MRIPTGASGGNLRNIYAFERIRSCFLDVAGKSFSQSTRVRVTRQSYIDVHADEIYEVLGEKLSAQGELDNRWERVREALQSLKILYSAEYHRAGEELQDAVDTLNSCVLTSESSEQKTRLRVDGTSTFFTDSEGVHELEQNFLKQFHHLVGKAHFQAMSERDSAMADALNRDYLSQLFIRPSPSETDGALVEPLTDPSLADELRAVAVLRRGWGSQVREGALIAQKLDHLQQAAARAALRGARALADHLQAWTCAAWRRARGPAAKPSAMGRVGAEPAPRGGASKAAASSGGLGWRLAHLVAPPSGRDRIEEFERRWPVREPSRTEPLYIERVTVGDTLGGDSLSALWRRGLLRAMLSRSKLVEPTFRQVMVVYRGREEEDLAAWASECVRRQRHELEVGLWRLRGSLRRRLPGAVRERLLPGERPRPPPLPGKPRRLQPVRVRVYKDIPVPIWRVCFPQRQVAFKPLDLLKVDLMAMVGVAAILAQIVHGSQQLEIIWLSSLLAQAMRVVFGYTRMYSQFEGYVHETLHGKTVVGEDAVGQFLAAGAAGQQFRQAAVLYMLLCGSNAAGVASTPEAAALGQRLDLQQVAREAEDLLALCGAKVSFSVGEALHDLRRFGAVVLQDAHAGDGTEGRPLKVKVLPPEEACAAFEHHFKEELMRQRTYGVQRSPMATGA